jgi:hypothetical protein
MKKELKGRAMAQAVSRRLLTAEARVRTQVRPCGICDGQSGTGAGFSPQVLLFSSVEITAVAQVSYIIWGWIIGPLVAAVQRQSHLIDMNDVLGFF